MKQFKLPTRDECFDLLVEYEVPDNIMRHTHLVNTISVFLAKRLNLAGVDISVDAVDRASLLHDLDKMMTIKKPTHGEVSEKILTDKGYTILGKIVKKHKCEYVLEDLNWEAKVVNYADVRVMHDQIVSVNKRLKDGWQRYKDVIKKKNPRIKERFDEIEKEIFDKIDLDPKKLVDYIKIKAIVFDFGDVLSVPGANLNALKKYAHKLHTSPEDSLRTVINSEELQELMRGKISLNEFNNLLAKLRGTSPKIEEAIGEQISINTSLDNNVMQLVKDLKKNYKLAILSDHIKGVFEKHVERFALTNYFDYILFSAEIGFLKADRDIFQILLDTIKLKANECVFIDDREVNIRVAESLGFKTIHFKSADTLRVELLNQGVIF